jgi:hypothetical protein
MQPGISVPGQLEAHPFKCRVHLDQQEDHREGNQYEPRNDPACGSAVAVAKLRVHWLISASRARWLFFSLASSRLSGCLNIISAFQITD